jgi:serine/threonine protein phosphatase PrpC
MLYLANAGDSITFVACYHKDKGLPIWKTKVHKPDQPGERARIEKCGGVIREANPRQGQSARLSLTKRKGSINFSRSIGDRDATPVGVIPDPTVEKINVTDMLSSTRTKDWYVVSVTDGMSDVFLLSEIATDIGQQLFADDKNPSKQSLQEICESLVDSANNQWIKFDPYDFVGDDMSIAVHKLL